MTRSEPARAAEDVGHLPWRSIAALGGSVGLITGVIEAVITVGGKVVFNAAKGFGLQFWWMAPVAETVLFTLIAVAVAVVLRLLGRDRTWPPVLGVLVFAATLSIVLLFHRVDKYAALILALGFGVRAFFLARRRSPPALRTLGRTAVAGAAVVLLGAIAVEARPRELGRLAAAMADGTRPNVLLIVLDTEGAAALHLYGYPRATSNVLDSLATSSVVFSRAYATAPWTLPSHASMFTGRDAHELAAGFRTPLDATYPTLAETLRRQGYQTGGFVANLRFTNREFGLARGFDHYEDYARGPAELILASSLLRRLAVHGAIRDLLGYHDIVARKRGHQVTAGVLDWVDANRGRPWFAFLNYWDAHEPYLPPQRATAGLTTPAARRDFSAADYRLRETILHNGTRKRLPEAVNRAERDAYDASVAAVDEEVGKLLRGLSDRALLDRTIIIITSDHGEEHGERGDFAHAHSVNPAALWIPLIVRYPPLAPGGRRIDSVVSARRLPATVLDLSGIRPQPTMAGPSLAAYWRDAATPSEEAISTLANDGDTAYSVILGAFQFQRDNGVDRLFPVEPVESAPRDLIDDPRYRTVAARGRAILDSILRTGNLRRIPAPAASSDRD